MMTLAEFKAWFEGFTEDMDGAPSEKQFQKIRAKVKEITGTPMAPVVIREYVDRYRPYWSTPAVPYYIANGVGISGGMIVGDASAQSAVSAQPETLLHDLGKAEYRAMQ
jgi:hypothetical protein